MAAHLERRAFNFRGASLKVSRRMKLKQRGKRQGKRAQRELWSSGRNTKPPEMRLPLKRRAQLTFSSKGKVKAFGKPDAAHLAQVRHSFVRARREPLDDHADVADSAILMCN